jgi:hypothetical protein
MVFLKLTKQVPLFSWSTTAASINAEWKLRLEDFLLLQASLLTLAAAHYE